MNLIRRARARAADDSGISITELLVTIMISTIVLAAVGTMFINIGLVTSNANRTIERNGIATNIMDDITNVIRTAANNPISTSIDPDPALIAATTSSLTVYSFVNTNPTQPAPTKVRFTFDASGNLVEERWTATKSGSYWVFTGTAVTRTVGGPVQNVTGTPAFFTYFDSSGALVTPGSGGLTLSQRKAISSITVTVQIANQPTTGTAPIELINTIGMPNLRLGSDG